jgi:HPt (histidine-containing phosphotransfer) domain-containing protein
MTEMNYTYINLDYLNEVSDGDIDFVNEIINDYLNKVPIQFVELQAAVNAGDDDAARFIAHKMKSSFQFMGVEQLVLLAQQIENAEMDQKDIVFNECIGTMTPIIHIVLDELKHKLSTL